MPSRQIDRWRHLTLIAATVATIAIGGGAAVVGSDWVNPSPTPPAAITTPDTGLCAAPAGHTSWYVKQGGTGADNGSSWADAWTSFAAISWGSIQPGDTLYIDGGPLHAKVYTEAFTVGSSGSAGAPVTICPGQDAGHDGIVKFDFSASSPAATFAAIDLRGQSYVTISGSYTDGARHLEINNLYNTSTQTTASGVADSDGGSSHVTIDHIHFVNDNNGVRFSGPGLGTLVEYDSFDGDRGDAGVSFATAAQALDSVTITHNQFVSLCHAASYPSATCAGPDGVQTTGGTTISFNTFTEQTTSESTSGQHPDSIQNPASNIKVYGNAFVNVGDSNFDFDTYFSATPHDVYVYDNVFAIQTAIDSFPDFVRMYHNTGLGVDPTSFTNIVVANNVFADADSGTNIPPVNIGFYGWGVTTPAATGSRFTNNIFVNDGDTAANNGFMLYVASTTSGWTADHNVYYRASDARVSWMGTASSAATFVATVDTSGSVSLPTFVSYTAFSASNDFHLQAGDSVARDKGTSLASLFTIALDGTARPQGSAWDIGAYER